MAYLAEIEEINGSPVRRVRLRVPDNYRFRAGQYLLVHGPDQVDIPLSIASAPATLPRLCLHFRPTPGLAESSAMIAALAEPTLQISGSLGEVTCAPATEPQLIIAGGTGAAQAFSCAQQRADLGATAATSLVWCVDQPEDLYSLELLRGLPNTNLHTFVDDRRTADNEGLLWLDHNAARFTDAQVIIAGSPQFVYLVTDRLIAAGIDPDRLQADAYSYAPRGC